MSKSSKSARPKKSKKPYVDFPLTVRTDGRLSKKHRGKVYYFGTIDDWHAALERYKREWPCILQGRTPLPADAGDGCTIQYLANSFLTSKKNKLGVGELSRPSFANYYDTCERLVSQFGRERRVDDLGPRDFETFRKQLAKKYGPTTLKNEINRCRIVLKYAHDQRLIDREVHYGQSFDKPSAKELRRVRNEAGPRLYEADEVRQILDAADPVMRAMVLLGANCGFGNTDVANLPQSAVDLDNDWVNFPRPKTEIQRRIPLWPETVKAMREAIAIRPEPANPDDAGLCFLTGRGCRWVRTSASRINEERYVKYVTVNTLARRFGLLLKNHGINGRRGLGFYTLRHVFETIAGESKDQVAVNAIMGHVDSSMAGVYRERISDERLRAVVSTVHGWLFGGEDGPSSVTP